MGNKHAFENAVEGQIRRLRTATTLAYVAAFSLLVMSVAHALNDLRATHAELERVVATQLAKLVTITDTQMASLRRADTVQLLILETEPFRQDRVFLDYLKYGYDVGDGRNKTRAMLETRAEHDVMARQDEIVAVAVDLHDRIADLARRGEFDRARALYVDELGALHLEGSATFAALRELQTATTQATIQAANEAYQEVFRTTLLTVFASVLAATGVGMLSYHTNRRVAARLHDNVGNLRHMALHDSLTGLLNRTAFTEHVERCFAQDDAFALLYMDLDGFKTVNDEHGHDIGDQLLMMAAGRIRSRLRGIDTVARIGGDEFVALVTGVEGIQQCEHAAAHIIAAFTQPFVHGEIAADIGISIGIALAPHHGEDPAGIMNAADRAMYSAKNLGSNRYTIYEPAVQPAFVESTPG
ncbi:MAG: GGDEF domain-containing protein [Gammaproteobacteria bacterium]|nr:GGDEF domain-containing protein [Gammaproteobacteria bacterium]